MAHELEDYWKEVKAQTVDVTFYGQTVRSLCCIILEIV
jgi:hypothetical protein